MIVYSAAYGKRVTVVVGGGQCGEWGFVSVSMASGSQWFSGVVSVVSGVSSVSGRGRNKILN